VEWHLLDPFRWLWADIGVMSLVNGRGIWEVPTSERNLGKRSEVGYALLGEVPKNSFENDFINSFCHFSKVDIRQTLYLLFYNNINFFYQVFFFGFLE